MGLRLGLLSTASINAKLVAGARSVSGVDVVAVGSRDAGRARAQADALGIDRAHGSYEGLLADPEVDAIYVSLPNALHVEWSIAALQAGKHVLCEKPMAPRVADVERAFDAADAAGLVLAEAFMWRHTPQAARLAELAASEIGELRLVRATFSFGLGPERQGDVRLSRELEGGALMDVGCYCVSGARLIAGEPEEMQALSVVGGDGVDVRLSAVMRHPGGVLSHFDCGIDMAVRDELEVVGSEGSLWLDDPWHARSPVIEVRRAGGSIEQVECELRDPYGCELEDFAAAVRGERPPLLAREDAVGQARVIAALLP